MKYSGEPGKDFKVASFCQLVLALEVAHKAVGRVHCDLRLPNVTFSRLPNVVCSGISFGRACLIDWGRSATVDTEAARCSCHAFSPIRCPCVEERKYGPKDDLCSLVLLYVYMVQHGNGGTGPAVGATPEARWHYWNLTGQAVQLYKMALEEDYEGLKVAWGRSEEARASLIGRD